LETLHEEEEKEDKEESPCLLTKDMVILLLLLPKKNLPFNASQQSASSSYPYSFSCPAQKKPPSQFRAAKQAEKKGAEKITERQKNPKQESHAPRFALMELFSSASCANTRKI